MLGRQRSCDSGFGSCSLAGGSCRVHVLAEGTNAALLPPVTLKVAVCPALYFFKSGAWATWIWHLFVWHSVKTSIAGQVCCLSLMDDGRAMLSALDDDCLATTLSQQAHTYSCKRVKVDRLQGLHLAQFPNPFHLPVAVQLRFAPLCFLREVWYFCSCWQRACAKAANARQAGGPRMPNLLN